MHTGEPECCKACLLDCLAILVSPEMLFTLQLDHFIDQEDKLGRALRKLRERLE